MRTSRLLVKTSSLQLRRGRICNVLVRNDGQLPVTYSVIGRDPNGAIRYEGQRGRLRLLPGKQARTDLRLTAKGRPFIGITRSLPFEIVVSTPTGKHQMFQGQLEVRPRLPIRPIMLLFAVIFIFCAAATALSGALSGGNAQAMQTDAAEAAEQIISTPSQKVPETIGDLGDDKEENRIENQSTAIQTEPISGANNTPVGAEVDEPGALPADQEYTRSTPRRPFHGRVGWAYAAYPENDLERMRADLRRMRDYGANIVYIGHANPGEPDAVTEPGLSFSIYYAIKNETPLASRALEIKDAVGRAVQAAAEVGLDVVLPIGYQLQMGREWNAANQSHLRLNPDGSPMTHWDSGPTASPYSPQFQQDIREYYDWINKQFVQSNRHIVALNLGDEPMGADYSSWAQDSFVVRYGRHFWETDVAYQRGEFLSHVLADAAASLSSYWQEINPEVWVMMTFHVERSAPWYPDFEAVFAKTPDNFVFAADTHYHDGLPTKPVVDISLLESMVRTLGWYSFVYDKPLMLWSSANNWGLRGTTLGVEEAIENFTIVFNESRRNGGKLSMIMVWGYNIRFQGMYRLDGAEIGFDPDHMFEVISTLFQDYAAPLDASEDHSPSHVLLLAKRELYETIGAQFPSHLSAPIVDLTGYRDLLGQQNSVVLITGNASMQARDAGANEIALFP